MMGVAFMFFNWGKKKEATINRQSTDVFNSLENFGYNGEQFLNGWGLDKDYQVVNTRLLQLRSLQLYRSNSIASNIFSTFLNGVVNKGLRFNSTPNNKVLGLKEDYIKEKRAEIENKWKLFSSRPITKNKQDNFAEVCKKLFLTTMLSGDCLVIVEVNKQGEPVLQLIDGLYIDSGFQGLANQNIINGIEFDPLTGEHKAFYVTSNLVEPIRIPAKTKRGRVKAFLVKSHLTKRVDDIRGLPLLSPVLQMINEAGRSIVSEQRAGYVNSLLALVHTKAENQLNRMNPLSTSNPAPNQATNVQNASGIDFRYGQSGIVKANLNPNEKFETFKTDRPNVNMMEFNNRITDNIAQALNAPPEILKKAFNSNYSASRQASKDWYKTTDVIADEFSYSFAYVITSLWLDLAVLSGKIKLDGYLEALINNNKDITDSWKSCYFTGSSDENIDVFKQAKADELALKYNWLTNEEITRARYGGDWETNAKKRKEEENEFPTVVPIVTEENILNGMEDINDEDN